ncbi:hypothetical protein D7004_02900 [Pedobacter jejuensis]|uniref:Uncharacterized protein n=1 Tax=Pedobacter jejuensis TaxID=1268550 RepID=A0A3N0C1L2_9SPHI|nr:hypothetical protein D7004_02900 [Pedobacter jejuensis]
MKTLNLEGKQFQRGIGNDSPVFLLDDLKMLPIISWMSCLRWFKTFSLPSPIPKQTSRINK